MADTVLSVENLSSLKVADLKRELKDRGLTTSGNKTDLIERLTAYLEAEGDVVVTEDISIGDASLSLNDTGGEGAAKLDISVADDSLLDEDKEVVLETTTEKPVRQKITMSETPKTENGHVAAAEVPKVLTAEERLKLRSERFGIHSEDSRKKARAERFGVTGSTTTTTKAPGKIVNTPVSADDLDKLKKRAERFGTVVSTSLTKVEEQEKIKKRKERFGATTGAALSDDAEAKKRKRAERFGMS